MMIFRIPLRKKTFIKDEVVNLIYFLGLKDNVTMNCVSVWQKNAR